MVLQSRLTSNRFYSVLNSPPTLHLGGPLPPRRRPARSPHSLPSPGSLLLSRTLSRPTRLRMSHDLYKTFAEFTSETDERAFVKTRELSREPTRGPSCAQDLSRETKGTPRRWFWSPLRTLPGLVPCPSSVTLSFVHTAYTTVLSCSPPCSFLSRIDRNVRVYSSADETGVVSCLRVLLS